MNLVRAACAIATAAMVSAAAYAAPADRSRYCSLIPFPDSRNPQATLLLGVALPDTVLAGPGGVRPGDGPGHWGRGDPRTIYGQLLEIEAFAGADSTTLADAFRVLPAPRVVVVPWDYDPGCRTAIWSRSAQWIPPSEPGAFDVRIRPRSDWADGVPTFDAFAADMKPYPLGPFFQRGYRRTDSVRTDHALTAVEYFQFARALSERDRAGALNSEGTAAILTWEISNPELAAKHPAARILGLIRSNIRGQSIRRYFRDLNPDIGGTYRITFTLAGSAPRTIYARTHANPSGHWYIQPPPDVPEGSVEELPRPDGYTLLFAGATSLDRVPAFCTGSVLPAHGSMDVLDPPRSRPDAADEWLGEVHVSLLANLFRRDSTVQSFTHASFEEFSRRDDTAPRTLPARLWREADGRIRLAQTLVLSDGRRLALTGERVSERTFRCAPLTAEDAAIVRAEMAAATRVLDSAIFMGRVVEESTGNPVTSGVVLTAELRSGSPGAIDSAGYYRLMIPTGEASQQYTLAANVQGYYRELRSVSVPAGRCVEPSCPEHPDTVNFRVRRAPREVRNRESEARTGDAVIDSVVVIGRVVDEHTRRAAPGATVHFTDGGRPRSQHADSLGFFRIFIPVAADSTRTYVLGANALGYIGDGRAITVPPGRCERVSCPQQSDTLNFYLRRRTH